MLPEPAERPEVEEPEPDEPDEPEPDEPDPPDPLPPVVKLAVIFQSCVIVNVHVGDVPEHGPDQPLNDAPGPGVSVSVRVTPAS